jgi:hypothetical protein
MSDIHEYSHVSNVVSVYNPETKLVSPQYLIVFDEDFTSVIYSPGTQEYDEMLEGLLNDLFDDVYWKHSDMFSDTLNTTHKYFDSTWDFLHMEEIAHKSC